MNERQQILDLTDGGLDIFTHYLGDVCLILIISSQIHYTLEHIFVSITYL